MAFKEEILIGSKADTRGFKKAETAASKLTKQVKSLGAALGISLGTAAVVAFGKASVKAFQDAEKSNAQLANSVKNLGLAFAQTNITSYLDKISESSGIAGETLNESFQTLLNSTGSFLKSQELLNLALDVSAGSGKSLVSVATDLSQAYTGNTRGLRKYNLGLTQGQLKTAKFAELQAKLNKQFSGANAAFLDTYAGKLQILTEAAGNAQEIIGGGLVDALVLAGGQDGNIESVGDAMAGLAEYSADAVRGVGALAGIITGIDAKLSGGFLGKIISANFQLGWIGQLAKLGDSTQERPRAGRRFMGGNQANLYDADAAAEKKFRAQQKKFQDASLLAQKKAAAEKKKELALKKAGSIFDVDQAGILAALQGKITQEERKRLELQFALLTGNVDQAKALTFEIAKAQGLGKDLAGYLASLPDAKNPFESWAKYLDMLEAQVLRIAKGTPSSQPSPSSSGSSMPSTNTVPSYTGTPFGQAGSFVDTIGTPFGQAGGNGSGYIGTPFGQAGSVVVQIDGKAVASALQDSSLSGIGSSVNRTGR
jgi:hypothetical protein